MIGAFLAGAAIFAIGVLFGAGIVMASSKSNDNKE